MRLDNKNNNYAMSLTVAGSGALSVSGNSNDITVAITASDPITSIDDPGTTTLSSSITKGAKIPPYLAATLDMPIARFL